VKKLACRLLLLSLIICLSGCGLADFSHIRGFRTPIGYREATPREAAIFNFALRLARPDLCLSIPDNVYSLGGGDAGGPHGGDWSVYVSLVRSDCINTLAATGYLNDPELCSHVKKVSTLIFESGNGGESWCRKMAASGPRVDRLAIGGNGLWVNPDSLRLLNLSVKDFQIICMDNEPSEITNAKDTCINMTNCSEHYSEKDCSDHGWNTCMQDHLYPPVLDKALYSTYSSYDSIRNAPRDKKYLCSQLVKFDFPLENPKPIDRRDFCVNCVESFLVSSEGKPFLDALVDKIKSGSQTLVINRRENLNVNTGRTQSAFSNGAKRQEIRLLKMNKIGDKSTSVTIEGQGFAFVDDGSASYMWQSSTPPRLEITFEELSGQVDDCLNLMKQGNIANGKAIQLLGDGIFKAIADNGVPEAGIFHLYHLESCKLISGAELPSK